jgi:hypothetical protein
LMISRPSVTFARWASAEQPVVRRTHVSKPRSARAAAMGKTDLRHQQRSGAHLAKDDVLAVEPRRVSRADEELGPIGVGAGVRHREAAHARVLAAHASERLVLKLVAVDRLAASAVTAGEIAALAHCAGRGATGSKNALCIRMMRQSRFRAAHSKGAGGRVLKPGITR